MIRNTRRLAWHLRAGGVVCQEAFGIGLVVDLINQKVVREPDAALALVA